MTSEIGSSKNAEKYVTNRLANKQKLMGFGHRVYRTMDPRAKILKEMAKEFLSTERAREDFQILLTVEEAVLRGKNLYPHVDLYSGLALNHVGMPTSLFQPAFG